MSNFGLITILEKTMMFVITLPIFFPQNTIAGRMAYFPIVGRLDCGSSSEEHQGFWEMHGYGIMAIYKSDWARFGGRSTQNNFRTNCTSLCTTIFSFSRDKGVTCMRDSLIIRPVLLFSGKR